MNKDQVTRANLKLIGLIKKNQKIFVKGKYLRCNGWWTSLIRSFIIQDDRENALKFITDTLTESLYLLSTYKDQKKTYHYKNIHDDLKQSMQGLENLKNTYSSDANFCCNIDVIVQDIIGKGGFEVDKKHIPDEPNSYE